MPNAVISKFGRSLIIKHGFSIKNFKVLNPIGLNDAHFNYVCLFIELLHERTCFLHLQKQRHRSCNFLVLIALLRDINATI